MNKSRLEAFSDGVIAIIITIMVLELKVPHDSDWTVLQKLAPLFISYIMSFIFIGIYWGNHHHLLQSIKNVTSGIMWANLNLLFWMSMIPFVTAWMGVNNFASNTVALYGVLLLFNGFAFNFLQRVVVQNMHNRDDLIKAFTYQKKKSLISALCHLSGIGSAYYSSVLAGICFFLASIMWLIPEKKIEKALELEDEKIQT
ncbi:MAG: DUF1211 domain-containing protein [Opitutaceae bacterium]|nr:DUF1211 domain-containing protein [Cytophagales bacterium]